MTEKLKAIFGKRKFTVALLALFMSFGLAVAGRIDGGNWQWCVTAIVGLYGAVEAAEGVGHSVAKNRSA